MTSAFSLAGKVGCVPSSERSKQRRTTNTARVLLRLPSSLCVYSPDHAACSYISLDTCCIPALQGGASGIGLATVRAFLEAGVKGVTLVDLNKANLSKVQGELEKQYSGRTLAVSGDVATEDVTQEYVEETMKKWGHLDVSIQNAGIW